MAKKKRTPANKKTMNSMFDNYEIKTSLDVQKALKDMFAETLESMLEAELDNHLGYDKSANNEAETTNRKETFSQQLWISMASKSVMRLSRKSRIKWFL